MIGAAAIQVSEFLGERIFLSAAVVDAPDLIDVFLVTGKSISHGVTFTWDGQGVHVAEPVGKTLGIVSIVI